MECDGSRSAMEVGVRQSSVRDACIDRERFSGGAGNLEHILELQLSGN